MNALATPVTSDADPIRITDTVSYIRPGYRIPSATVTALDEGTRRASVLWQDEFGQHREMLVGVEFLRKAETPTSDGAGAS